MMAKRTYESAAIRVYWDSSRCIHAGICLRMGEGTFDRDRRPWVDLGAADVSIVTGTIESCPSGALAYDRLDGEPGEIPVHPTSVVPRANGPLSIRGEFTVEDRKGRPFEVGPRATLCRCGASGNEPFCDNSHRSSGFRSAPEAPEAD